ncbi:MAG: MFS transporter [Oscillospiraceae bacterium]
MKNLKQTTHPLRYAIGMFGTSIPINMFKTYAAIFYVDSLGITTRQFSLVVFIYTFVDAIDNPIYGFLSDRTRTRWGRRRPWLLIGAPLLALCFISFFNVPGFLAGNSLFGYFLLMYILTGTLDSLVNANYGALFPELYKSDEKRAVTNALRQAFQLVAMVISIALTPLVTQSIGYSKTALIYGILAVAVICYCAVGCKENPHPEELEKPRLLSTIRDLLTNPKFWVFGLTNAFYSAAMSLVMSAVPFFVKYTLQVGNSATSILLGTVLLVAIIGVMVWAKLVKKFTLLPTWRGALIFMALAFIPLYFANSLVMAIVFSSLVGFGIAGAMATMDLIGAKIMDDDTARTGLRREGIYSSAMGFMNRLNGFFVSLAFLLIHALYGFESGDVPGPNPGSAARFLLVIAPLVLMILSCISSRFMNFKNMRQAPAEEEAAPE